jgi:hypothetical protein
VLLGICSGGAQLVPGNLNHRRWLLAERDGAPVDVDAQPIVLDFGGRPWKIGGEINYYVGQSDVFGPK